MATIPVAFPEDVKTAPLVTLKLDRLIQSDVQEQARLYEASKALGFFYLDLRGCPEGESLLASADILFNVAKDVFELPVEKKLTYDFAAQGKYFGYKGMGAEVIDGAGTRDRNEIYNISKDDILEIGESLPQPGLVNERRGLLKRYITQNNAVLQTLFNSFTQVMKLPSSSSLATRHRLSAPSGCHVRFIRAPPQPPEQRQTALGEHTDFGSLTILFNRIGGLQVLLPGSEEWVYVKPMPGCAIINLGDAMVKFTAGLLRSNLHRVVSPPGAQADLVRYSLVYFCRPEHDIKLGRLKGGDIDLVEGSAEEADGESAQEWLKRRHLGRKVQFFKGSESWEGAKGTEGARL
ncbi:Clavaminate synthase-like protein [Rhizodiscina lignyota]|uniref:Clavaminate synthase-like protein n=1 Tax=Rhizodiscina lignyota TaxID=1504668 RepID=A0A9P4M5L8_9PEZI|nr:Clavaminate synthase-like protein [Rhizodiscina lignyota]